MALTAIEHAKENMPYFNPRHGIVHCQITDKPLLERISTVGAAAFVQPVFIDYDMDICKGRVGDAKAASSYAWKTLLNSGVLTAFGTDCPVETFDSMRGIWCAVTRRKLDGSTAFNIKEALSLREALHCYTAAGAP
jgi:predicted amidohydrolase YtcJ